MSNNKMAPAGGEVLKPLNLLMLGDTKVGKTSLMHRFVNDSPPTDLLTTVGVSFLAKVKFAIVNLFSSDNGYWRNFFESSSLGYCRTGVYFQNILFCKLRSYYSRNNTRAW